MEIREARDLTFSIAKLELEYGDILVVRSTAAMATFNPDSHHTLAKMLPAGVRILYIPREIELSVLTKAEIEAKAV